MIRRTWTAATLTTLGLALLGGCDQGTAPGGTAFQPVSFSLTSNVATGSPGGPLSLRSVRLVAGAASFGAGDQFGCVDCQQPEPETIASPTLVDVPLDGGAVQVATEQVRPGSYAEVEISLVRPTAGILAGNPGWESNASIEVRGDYNGAAFTLALAIEGSFRDSLTPPVVISEGTQPSTVHVTITLPVSAWFGGPSGPLDPNDPAQRAMIEANARRSFSAPESATNATG